MGKEFLKQQITDMKDDIWELQQVIRYDDSISEKRSIEIQLEIIQLAYKIHMKEYELRESSRVVH